MKLKNIKKDLQRIFFIRNVFSINENEIVKKIDLIINNINTNSFSDAAFNFSISDTSKNGGNLDGLKKIY